MALHSPVKKIYITQVFGVNKANYERFGLQGHNGIDYRAFLPNGERCYEGGKSEVFAPHAGTVLENVNDANGYGWYIKIENEKEGSVLAHFSSQSPCKVGSTVKQGEFVGFQGTSGNSTGIHLHWGYYEKPRDRSNGFNGYINQEGKYLPYGGGQVMANELETCLIDRKKFWDERDDLLRSLDAGSVEEGKNTIAGYKSRITDLGNRLGTALAEVANRKEQLGRVENEVLRLTQQNNVLDSQLISVKGELDEMAKSKGTLAIENGKLQQRIDTLEAAATEGKVTISVWDFINLVLKQKITISR